MKTIRLLTFLSMLISPLIAGEEGLLGKIKGSDLVNAAKMALEDDFSPPSDLEKLLSMYALGFIEGSISSDIQKNATSRKHDQIFQFGTDKMTDVFALIVEYVDKSPTLRSSDGTVLLHSLLCIRYGATPEVRESGAKILSGLSAQEARKLLDQLEQERKKKSTPANQAAGDQSTGQPGQVVPVPQNN